MRSEIILPRGLRRTQAAAYIGVSPSKFDALRCAGTFPNPRLLDRVMVWDRLDLDAFFDALPSEAANDDQPNPWDDL